MGSRAIDNLNSTLGPGPNVYEVPSKVFPPYFNNLFQILEHPGKSMGIRVRSHLNKTVDIPGPGAYSPE
jgi:hypothetical protein